MPDPTKTLPETIAAVDLGSNSFHLIVARIENGQLQIIDRLKEMVRLGAGLTKKRQLDEASQERALECLSRFGQRLRGLPGEAVRAVGTNTLRQVRDGGAFLHRAEQALGHPIEIVAGREEARLVYLGVAHGLAAGDERRLVVDIGGGSTELIIGQGMEPKERESLSMGCVSYSQRFFPDGRIGKRKMDAAILAGRLEIHPVRTFYDRGNWELAVGSSGTIRSIRDLVQAQGWSDQGISRKSLKKLRKALIEAGHVERLDFPGLSEARRPVFAGGVAVLSAVFQALDIEQMRVSDLALREGLLFELLGSIRHHDSRERTVETLLKRYSLDADQARRVAATARQLLEKTETDWGLEDPELARLLDWAARLHEIGLAISHSGYHRHGAYILANADLAGFSRQSQGLLAALVRSHRRRFAGDWFDDLDKKVREPTRRMAILLRLAVLLHRGRGTHALPPVGILAEGKNIAISFPGNWLEEHPLTEAELALEAEQLERGSYFLTYS